MQHFIGRALTSCSGAQKAETTCEKACGMKLYPYHPACSSHWQRRRELVTARKQLGTSYHMQDCVTLHLLVSILDMRQAG